jgi:hypothetical protein
MVKKEIRRRREVVRIGFWQVWVDGEVVRGRGSGGHGGGHVLSVELHETVA